MGVPDIRLLGLRGHPQRCQIRSSNFDLHRLSSQTQRVARQTKSECEQETAERLRASGHTSYLGSTECLCFHKGIVLYLV